MADGTNRPLELIPARTLAHDVLDRLRLAILDGVLQPGSQLNQVGLARELGASRGTIRGALSKLEEEGLVRNEPFRRSFVVDLNRKSLQDLYGLRTALEAYAVRLAVPCCTDHDIDYLVDLIGKMRRAVTVIEVPQLIACDLAFHRRLLELSGNDMLPKSWATLQLQLRRYLTRRYQQAAVRARWRTHTCPCSPRLLAELWKRQLRLSSCTSTNPFRTRSPIGKATWALRSP